jgi:putative metallohydrolase (TIGR04338 family)
MSRRDPQQGLVYRTEDGLRWLYENAREGAVNVNGVRLQLEPTRGFETLASVQRFVDRATTNVAVIAELGPVPSVKVLEGHQLNRSHYRYNTIVTCPRSEFGMAETTIVHELAHHYSRTECVSHGPAFAAAEVALTRLLVGPQAALALRILFDSYDVKVGI